MQEGKSEQDVWIPKPEAWTYYSYVPEGHLHECSCVYMYVDI